MLNNTLISKSIKKGNKIASKKNIANLRKKLFILPNREHFNSLVSDTVKNLALHVDTKKGATSKQFNILALSRYQKLSKGITSLVSNSVKNKSFSETLFAEMLASQRKEGIVFNKKMSKYRVMEKNRLCLLLYKKLKIKQLHVLFLKRIPHLKDVPKQVVFVLKFSPHPLKNLTQLSVK